jgi:hypothetical protein
MAVDSALPHSEPRWQRTVDWEALPGQHSAPRWEKALEKQWETSLACTRETRQVRTLDQHSRISTAASALSHGRNHRGQSASNGRDSMRLGQHSELRWHAVTGGAWPALAPRLGIPRRRMRKLGLHWEDALGATLEPTLGSAPGHHWLASCDAPALGSYQQSPVVTVGLGSGVTCQHSALRWE